MKEREKVLKKQFEKPIVNFDFEYEKAN